MTQTIFINATWKDDIKLNKGLINYLIENKVKSIALFASVQFLKLEIVKKQLMDLNIKIKMTDAKRTSSKGQILGCDVYHDSFEDDIISECDISLYVGDGMFHPKALLLSQIYNKKIKPILIYDPTVNIMKIITFDDIINQIGKLRANITKFLSCNVVGILVTIKPGQQYLNLAKKLKKELELKGKKVFIFIDETLRIDLLENFPFIDCWVNTACPRIGTDDLTTISKSLINVREAFNPEECLIKLYVEK